MGHSFDGTERRQFLRVFKNYSLVFYFKDAPAKKSDETFLKDISKGGVRFTTSQPITSGAHLMFEIGIPFIAPKKLTLEGSVIVCKEINPKLVYEIRARFLSVSPENLQVFDILEKQMLKVKKG